MAEESAFNKEQSINQNIATGENLVAFLRDIEARCLKNAIGLPKQESTEKNWEGVIFSIAGRLFATPINEVSEILNLPVIITRVPGTRAWVVGISNVRGNLLPIIDLQSFLLNRQTVRARRTRILVVNYDGLYSGLLVEPFVGIKRFFESEQTQKPLGLPAAIEKYVNGVYEKYEIDSKSGEKKLTTWPIFSMHRLIHSDNKEFRSAAI